MSSLSFLFLSLLEEVCLMQSLFKGNLRFEFKRSLREVVLTDLPQSPGQDFLFFVVSDRATLVFHLITKTSTQLLCAAY